MIYWKNIFFKYIFHAKITYGVKFQFFCFLIEIENNKFAHIKRYIPFLQIAAVVSEI